MRKGTAQPDAALATADRARLFVALATGMVLVCGALPRGPARLDRLAGFVCGTTFAPACHAAVVAPNETSRAGAMQVFALPGLVVIALATTTVAPLLMARLICSRRGGRNGP